MGFFKRLFSRKPVEVPQIEEDCFPLGSGEEINLKVVLLKEALKLDGWRKYRNKHVTQEEFIVSARFFTPVDPQVDLVTAMSEPGDYISIDSEDGASIFDKETFEDSFIEIAQ
jgi:hypothetical protein